MADSTTFNYYKQCKQCGKTFGVNKKQEFLKRKYCSPACSYADPERRERVVAALKKGRPPRLTREGREKIRQATRASAARRHEKWLNSNAKVTNGWGSEKRHELDITNRDLLEYRDKHTVCEICGRAEVVTVHNQHICSDKVIALAADHDHNTGHFRGLLCRRCNRALGWYDTYKDNIIRYLDKTQAGCSAFDPHLSNQGGFQRAIPASEG